MLPKNIFNLLQGTWTFQRSITHHGTVTGTARYIKSTTHELSYKEEGLYTSIAGQNFNSHREYIYTYQQEKLSVFFIDRRLFYTLNDAASAEHQCGEDHYKIFYSFHNNNKFDLRYEVTGPRKHYTIHTTYSRNPPQP